MSIHRILGCPGGGKTDKLTKLAARAAREYGGGSVLAVSLTRTAATELRGRAGAIPDENCATLHAHALRALEVDPATLAETPTAMREFMTDTGRRGEGIRGGDPDDPGSVPSLHVAVTNHRARMANITEWTEEEVSYLHDWHDWKKQTRRVDFTDLIQRCITEDVAPLQHPRVILADEAQDFTALEFTLLMAWARRAESTVCVGDSQQCIYWFRGADPERLDALPVARGETLAQSWRCPREVADAAKTWAAQLPGEAVEWAPRDAEGFVGYAPRALRDTEEVVEHHTSWGEQGEGTTMVLASCRYMLAPLCNELRARGIPFWNPWRPEEAAWNPLGGPGARAVRALMAPVTDGRMWTWGDLLDLTTPMRTDVLARGAKASIEEHCRTDQFGESRARDEVEMSTLLTLLGADPATGHLLLDIDTRRTEVLDWYADSLLARASKSVRYPLDVIRAGGSLTDEPRLTVGTIHSVKGGEADHVVLAPELSRDAYYGAWLGGSRGRDAIVRMGYVGMTRARETLTLLEPGCPEYMPVADVLREVAA